MKYRQVKKVVYLELQECVNLFHVNYAETTIDYGIIVKSNIIAVVYEIRRFYLAVIKRICHHITCILL